MNVFASLSFRIDQLEQTITVESSGFPDLQLADILDSVRAMLANGSPLSCALSKASLRNSRRTNSK